MKKTIKSIIIMGFLACSMMSAHDNSIIKIALNLKNTIHESFTDYVFYSFMRIFNRINTEEKGKLEKYVNSNANLSINEQIDRTIEYIAPRMNDDEKLEFCRKINKLKDFEDPRLNPFNNLSYLKKMILESDNQGTYYLILEEQLSPKPSTTKMEDNSNPMNVLPCTAIKNDDKTTPITHKINLNELSKLEEREFLQLFFALSEHKIKKIEKIIDCEKCYTDFITTKRK